MIIQKNNQSQTTILQSTIKSLQKTPSNWYKNSHEAKIITNDLLKVTSLSTKFILEKSHTQAVKYQYYTPLI